MSAGEFSTLLKDDTNDVYAFLRWYKKERVAIVINNSAKVRRVSVPLPDDVNSVQWISLLNGARAPVKNGAITVRLAAKSGEILEAKGK